MRLRVRLMIFVFIVIALFSIYVYFGLKEAPVYRNYTIESEKLTSEIKIVVLADMHSMDREENAEIIKMVQDEKPDCIFYVGDMFDANLPSKSIEDLMHTFESFKSYYVTGNHETSISREEIVSEVKNLTWLKNDTQTVEIGGNKISISGIDDLYHNEETWHDALEQCARNKDDSLFTILLSHRPEYAEEYEKYGFDLTVCGHTHGGQVRIPPFINGVMTPYQGWFPKYAGGRYDFSDNTMIVSRGLVINHRKRIYNPAEVVVLHLKPQEKN